MQTIFPLRTPVYGGLHIGAKFYDRREVIRIDDTPNSLGRLLPAMFQLLLLPSAPTAVHCSSFSPRGIFQIRGPQPPCLVCQGWGLLRGGGIEAHRPLTAFLVTFVASQKSPQRSVALSETFKTSVFPPQPPPAAPLFPGSSQNTESHPWHDRVLFSPCPRRLWCPSSTWKTPLPPRRTPGR